MLLQRETKLDVLEGATELVLSRGSAETLRSLAELNGQCLELLAEQALAKRVRTSLLCEFGDLWITLDAPARQRAAACPYLLVDAGFADPVRWRLLEEGRPQLESSVPFFTVQRASMVARQVFVYAWHLSQSKRIDAQLLLGMPTHCTRVIGSYTLPGIHALAALYPQWMCPRWPNRVGFWRNLLVSSASGEFIALETARMHGVQLLAADCMGPSLAVPDPAHSADKAGG